RAIRFHPPQPEHASHRRGARASVHRRDVPRAAWLSALACAGDRDTPLGDRSSDSRRRYALRAVDRLPPVHARVLSARLPDRDERWNALDHARWVEPLATRSSAALAAAGYYVAHDNDDAGWYCLVDAGPHGGTLTGHAHSDLGHVEIACGDRHVVCDPGSPSYT